MEGSPHLAVQLALQTLKERCQYFEERMSDLEKENISLRAKCSEVDDLKDKSLSEVDTLRRKIVELTEQKAQLKNNVNMVAFENRQLWSRLSKLSQDNKVLDSQLTKINDSLKHHTKAAQNSHSPLIRSKTFTQEEPYWKSNQKNAVEVHDKISIELEDISLKLISNIAKEKSELEMQCSQMAEIQTGDVNITSSFGFAYSYDDVNDTLIEDFEDHVEHLKNIRKFLLLGREKMVKNIENINTLEVDRHCNTCENRKMLEKEKVVRPPEENEEEKEELNSLMKWGSMECTDALTKNTPVVMTTSAPIQSQMCLQVHTRPEVDKICPMCSKQFTKDVPFNAYQDHVESHFTVGSNSLNAFEFL